MAGIGKSALVRKIFNDKSILSNFDYHMWITLGQKYQSKEILQDILTKISLGIDELHKVKIDDNFVRELCEQVSRKRCLIVLDDLYSQEPLLNLKNLFPDIKGTILVTTRLVKVAKFGRDDTEFRMKLLDKEDSWCLLRQKVFNGGLCPPELEKAGRQIAERCDGLPLLILTVGEQLREVKMSEEYWNNVASGKQKSVFKNAHYHISKALLPSYQSLPQHLKTFFLYMGIFRERIEITRCSLTHMLISEGFLKSDLTQTMEYFVAKCLFELANASLIMVHFNFWNDNIKTCRFHSVFWHLSTKQAIKNGFFYVIDSYDDCLIDSLESQRRLCIRNNILLGMKDVQNLMSPNTSAHSLLCVGPFQRYPVPQVFDFRFLRVMNATTIRLYEFPVEVVRLVHLRYLGLTCNGELPTSISTLWKLQYLIVKRYMNTKSTQNSWPLPVEIWDMEELRHLEIMGGCLPSHRYGVGLLKLSTLLDVSAQSCRKEVLEWLPNLKKLGIRIELKPLDEGKSLHYLNNIHYLHRLKSLKCMVVNPRIGSKVVALPAPISMFPPSLRKLSLSGTGYAWEHMSIIGKLEKLEVLKLKCYAFQGPKWDMGYTSQFEKLKCLLVEDSNLEQWKVNPKLL